MKQEKPDRLPKPRLRKKPVARITDSMIAMAQRKPATTAVNPFSVAVHPPSAIPSTGGMAQDEALNASLEWAASVGYSEGLSFLGYPYLSEIAQRPEYRRISETIATAMTRRWIKIQHNGDEDKSDKIKQIEAELKRLKVQDAFREAAEQDGFFGRSHIYLDFGTTDDAKELVTPIGDGRNDVSEAKIKRDSLKRIKTVEAIWCYPADYNSNDPLQPNWYKPSTWFVQGKQIHASRLLTFVGREVPDLLKPAYSFGGLSLSQMAKPYVDNWLRTRQSVSDLISSFSVSGIKTNMAERVELNEEDLFKRVALFSNLRDNRGTMVLDKDLEEFFNVSTPLGTLDKLQAQSLEHICSATGLPLVVYTGITPSGLNASSEGELRTFDEWINAYQELFFTENLTRVICFIQLSKFGVVDPAIGFEYEPLRSLDGVERATVQKIEAETGAILVGNRTITRAEERKRIAGDPDAPYASIDTDKLPDLDAKEKAEIATQVATAVAGAAEAGLIDQPIALKELAASAKITGIFATISAEDIAEAEANPPIPAAPAPAEQDPEREDAAPASV